jgi:hypothetical protein
MVMTSILVELDDFVVFDFALFCFLATESGFWSLSPRRRRPPGADFLLRAAEAVDDGTLSWEENTVSNKLKCGGMVCSCCDDGTCRYGSSWAQDRSNECKVASAACESKLMRRP